MMILSITDYNNKERIGGGYTPAIAFTKWCHILGHESELLTIEGKATEADYEQINKADALFIASPTVDIDAFRIKVPYVVMIHAEFDYFRSHHIPNLAKAIVCIDKDKKYWLFNKQLYWHPCTLPEYLLKGDEVFEQNKSGTIYSARLSRWKNAETLFAYSNLELFNRQYGPIDVFGTANDKAFGELLHRQKSNVYWDDRIYDLEDMVNKYPSYSYVWDVSGNNEYNLSIKRLNLIGYEAMKFGCIPIVNKEAVPKELHDFCIDFTEIDKNHNPHRMREIMLEKAKTEFFGYNQVKKQVEQIIEVLK